MDIKNLTKNVCCRHCCNKQCSSYVDVNDRGHLDCLKILIKNKVPIELTLNNEIYSVEFAKLMYDFNPRCFNNLVI